MNGADVLVQTSQRAGIRVCFANAGTTEMAIVDSLRRSEIRPIPVLFEGVASGAADGYARIDGGPAAVLLHLGPGLSNAGANLHNARRAQSPVVNWVGDHATWLIEYDPPLASDIESIAKGTSQWIRTPTDPSSVQRDAAEAVEVALGPPAGVSTLILPADIMSAEAPRIAEGGGPRATARSTTNATLIEASATQLREAKNPLLLIGGHVLDAISLRNAQRLAAATGAEVLLERFPRCMRRETSLPSPDKLAYLPFQARAQLEDKDLVVCLGADAPACFFGYEGQAPVLTGPHTAVTFPAQLDDDPAAVLAALCDALDAKPYEAVDLPAPTARPTGQLNPESICGHIARLLPKNAIVVDEGITSSLSLYPALRGAAPHDYLACKGGSIGFATPVSTGAAIAAPDRPVICYVGDGSAAYTLQSLWTQANAGLNVTTIVIVNHSYAVLQMELMRTGSPLEGAGQILTEITNPQLDYVHLARGYGVPARKATTAEEFGEALEASLAEPGPSLIAACLR